MEADAGIAFDPSAHSGRDPSLGPLFLESGVEAGVHAVPADRPSASVFPWVMIPS